MISCQMGAAPVIPDTRLLFIKDPSLLPTHVATRYFGVNPMVQLSRKLLEVPVLTAILWPSIDNFAFLPKAASLALLSDSISISHQAVRGESTCLPSTYRPAGSAAS